MTPEKRIQVSPKLPESVNNAIVALRTPLALSLAQWMASDARVVAYFAANGLPEPSFSTVGRPQKKKRKNAPVPTPPKKSVERPDIKALRQELFGNKYK